MRNSFILSSKILDDDQGINLITSSKDFYLYSDESIFVKYGANYVFFEGYFLPRNEWFNSFSHYKGTRLVHELFISYGPDFINKLKGFFIIIIVTKDNFYVYNDIHSVRRFYYHVDNQDFFISNNINALKSVVGSEADEQFAAHQALFQHFLFGRTIFKNIKYSEYASRSFLKSGRMTINKYWQTDSLYYSNHRISINDFISLFNGSIENYLNYYNPGQIASTITGGRDTRTVVASLLANNTSPHLFTFGNPENRDIIVGKLISESCKLSFSNPDMSNPDLENYKSLIERLIDLEDPFIHTHRAHRLEAIELEVKKCKYDILFVGAMGGDYIKGTSFDDYIVSEFLRKNFFERGKRTEDIIRELLEKHFVRHDRNLINLLLDTLLKIPFISDRVFCPNTDLHISHDIVGCTHDIQDIRIFSEYIDKVVAPYMDIDIMEALFQTDFSLFSNSKNSSRFVTKFLGGELQAKLVVDLCPRMASIPYANYYRPADVVGSKTKYIFKRGIAYIKQKRHPDISGFEYGEWFVNYIHNELPGIGESFISQFYDLNKLYNTFKYANHLTHEGYWHRYTNPIMFSKYFEKFNRPI